MPKVLAEIIIIGITIVVELVLWLAAGSIPPASGNYPKALLALAFLLSVSYLIICVRRIKMEGLPKPEITAAPGAKVQIFALCVFVCLYLGLLKTVGYVIMTPLFILGTLLFFGMRSKLALVLLPICMTGATYYLFNNILYVFLPRGILG